MEFIKKHNIKVMILSSICLLLLCFVFSTLIGQKQSMITSYIEGEGAQTRTCLERNNCGNTYGRPEIKRECITAPFELFDIMMTLESPVLKKSNNLVAVISFISFGNVPTPVDLTYVVLDSSETQVYSEKSGITVQTGEVIRKSFENLNLPPGDYTLVLTTVYGEDVTDEFRQAFSVEESVSFNWTIAIIVLIVILIILLFAIFFYYKRRKR